MTRRVWLPLLCGIATSALTWRAWGAWDPVPKSHDEAAYLLQAGIFAEGRWADPPPPLPEFFEQMHVLSQPRRAAKYPPGHALVLAPGAALGVPAAVPVALAGASGALLFLLARRAANDGVAVLAWLFWLAPSHPLYFRASYLSEATTSLLWLAGWWALAEWVETARTRWLLVLSLCVGWGAITRPLTTIAFAIPAALVAVARRRFRFSARQLAAAVLPAAAILLLLPLWSARTTGNPLDSPRALFTREYIPFDVPGFGPVAEAPGQRLSPDLRGPWFEYFRDLRVRHTLSALPSAAAARAAAVVRDFWEGWRAWLIPFTLLGLFVLPRMAWVAVASSALLGLLYLVYAHNPAWTVYYVESLPVVAFVTAAGIGAAVERLHARRGRRWAAAALAVAGLALGVSSVATAARLRISNRYAAGPLEIFRREVRAIGDPRAVVFVRYAPDHDPHRSLIFNGPDLEHARVWVAFDRGAENSRLCALAPDRVPYLYDEARRRMQRLPLDCRAPSL